MQGLGLIQPGINEKNGKTNANISNQPSTQNVEI
jgi:hypothetical protein